MGNVFSDMIRGIIKEEIAGALKEELAAMGAGAAAQESVAPERAQSEPPAEQTAGVAHTEGEADKPKAGQGDQTAESTPTETDELKTLIRSEFSKLAGETLNKTPAKTVTADDALTTLLGYKKKEKE